MPPLRPEATKESFMCRGSGMAAPGDWKTTRQTFASCCFSVSLWLLRYCKYGAGLLLLALAYLGGKSLRWSPREADIEPCFAAKLLADVMILIRYEMHQTP